MKAKFSCAKAIKDAREKAGLTQKKLSEKTGISDTEICSYECGRRNPGIDNLARLAKGLNISLDELYYGDCPIHIHQQTFTEGEIIAYCICTLWDKGVISSDLDDWGGSFSSSYQYDNESITLRKYASEILNLLDKLDTYVKDKETLPDPESFIEQIKIASANAINRQIH